MSLVYLFLIGMAFGAIWIFHGSNVKNTQIPNTLAFEENHKIVDVVVMKRELPVVALDIPTKIFPVKPLEKAFESNAVTMATVVDNKPQISIIIDDLGVVRHRTVNIIELPAPLTLSFLPYAPDLRGITRRARDRGHELMVHIPMEPKGDMDPGPHALLTNSSDQKILQDLHFNLSQFEGYVGINNHMGSAFTEDRPGLNLILDDIRKKGLLVLDSRTSGKSILAQIASEKNIPNITRDLFLDNEQDVSYILIQLEKLEEMARERGSAIAIGHPYEETVKALSIWLPTLKAKGIAIVPLSHLVKRKYEKIQLADGGGLLSASH